MTKEEFIKKLENECNTGDCEMDHAIADQLLLDFIDDIRVTHAFNAIEKWYS